MLPSHHRRGLRHFLPLLLASSLAVAAGAQQFVRNTTQVPASAGDFTEQVDFADIDDDGDWDAAFANGGGGLQAQNTLWVNQGFLQGGTLGRYLDETAARCPAILDMSRDVEFADVDGDGDVDLHVSNNASFLNQGNRWWVNMGGVQGGTIGYFQDQTSTRWVGLGGPGSSIAPSQVLAGGNFIDSAYDDDFGDLDNDGDLDLVHSSTGLFFNGNIPTRMFLNDGAGFFSEFNPSGFQLTGSTIFNGDPGLWCAGAQAANTTNSTGLACDIATTATDVEIGDIDGDLDLDLLHGARGEPPRMFRNLVVENGGTLSPWRDVTGAVFPFGYATGALHYEQELGDLDGDLDLDVYGVNWVLGGVSSYNDVLLANDGTGSFSGPVTVSGSAGDDDEIDFIDHDADGDLDAFVACYGGRERIHVNPGSGPLAPGSNLLPIDSTSSIEVECCDVDGDGDYDAFVTNDGNGTGGQEWYLQNTSTSDDVTPPTLARLEQAPDRVAGASATVVRVQLYDNAAYSVNWYVDAYLEVQLNGGALQSFPMRPSMGQIFRGEIPGAFAGIVSYRAVAIDEHGNVGASVANSYTATVSGAGTPFCPGDGSQTPCPCGNLGSAGHGCANSTDPAGGLLVTSGTTSPDTLVLGGSGMPASVSAIYLKGDQGLSTGVVFGDGVRCVDGTLIRLRTKQNVGGASQFPDSTDTVTVSERGATPPGSGLTGYYQTYYRNAAAAFCPPATFNVTNGVILVW